MSEKIYLISCRKCQVVLEWDDRIKACPVCKTVLRRLKVGEKEDQLWNYEWTEDVLFIEEGFHKEEDDPY